MPIDNKYGQVVVPGSTIAEDEPVVVFRGKDKLLPALLQKYAAMCRDAGSPEHHIDLIQDSYEQLVAWQAENVTKVPDSNNWSSARGR